MSVPDISSKANAMSNTELLAHIRLMIQVELQPIKEDIRSVKTYIERAVNAADEAGATARAAISTATEPNSWLRKPNVRLQRLLI